MIPSLRLAVPMLLLFAPRLAPPGRADTLVKYLVAPQATDSAIHRFTDPNYVVFEHDVPPSAPLFLFMSGTGGSPARTSDFLDFAAGQGYRVISLAYNDVPAVAQVCPRDPDPDCSARVRRKRIYGDDVSRRIDDTPAEAIVNRLVKLLAKLGRDHPSEGWNQYLDGEAPRWDRIAVSGLSQGAGMAAFIAQKTRVARVVLFSSPWDNYGPRQTLAPWVAAGPGATPEDRWFAAYHEKENTAALIRRAYSALRIPQSNLRVLTKEPARMAGDNPYHPSSVSNGATPREADGTPSYAGDWQFLLGQMR
jgi:hypothetical protein